MIEIGEFDCSWPEEKPNMPQNQDDKKLSKEEKARIKEQKRLEFVGDQRTFSC